MALAAVIDVDALVAPVSDETPAGTDPRSDTSAASAYYRLKDARNAARAAERAAVDQEAGTPDEWSTVLELGQQILGEAKDLEVAAWMTEALTRIEGLAGLRDGLTLIRRLAEDHWDNVFPLPDEDGMETRVAAVGGLSGSGATGTIAQAIRMTALTWGQTTAFGLWHYEQALDLEKITQPDRRQSRIEAGAVTMEAFRDSVAETASHVLKDTLETAEEARAALEAMAEAFDRLAGSDAPTVTGTRDLLDKVISAVRFFAADKLAAAQGAAVAAAGSGDLVDRQDAGTGTALAAAADGQVVVMRRPGDFVNREEALDLLSKISAWFRRTEPQSPISYTIEEAVRRARLTLPELLAELVQDPAHMNYFLLASGVRPSQPEESQAY